MSEKKTEVQQLALKLHALSASKKPYPNGPHGQIIGCESYILKGTGFSFSCIDEAAQKLIDLEKANTELLEALQVAHLALNAIYDEMTVGERYTNAGQFLVDAFPTVREMIEKHGGE